MTAQRRFGGRGRHGGPEDDPGTVGLDGLGLAPEAAATEGGAEPGEAGRAGPAPAGSERSVLDEWGIEVAGAWREGPLVYLVTAPPVADSVCRVLGDFERALTGAPGGLLRRAVRPLPDRKLFPDTYSDPDRSARFRREHGPDLRARLLSAVRDTVALLDEARTELPGSPTVTLDRQAVAAAFTALGQAQTVLLPRPRWASRVDWTTAHTRDRGRDLVRLTACQSALANAALTEPGDETLFTA